MLSHICTKSNTDNFQSLLNKSLINQACFTAPSWCRGPPSPPGPWWRTLFTMLSRWPTVSTVVCQLIWWRTTKISSSVSGKSHSQTSCLWMWKLRASWQQWGHLETVFLFPATLVHQASISGLLNSPLPPFLMLVFSLEHCMLQLCILHTLGVHVTKKNHNLKRGFYVKALCRAELKNQKICINN